MQSIQAHNFHSAVKLVHEYSRQNLLLSHLAGTGTDRDRVLYHLSKYAIEKAQARNGAYITPALDGVMLLFESPAKKRWLKEALPLVELIRKGTGLVRIIKVAWCALKLRKRRREGRFLYLHMAVSENNEDEALQGLSEAAIQISERLELPLITETVIWKNKVYYEAIGFETYQEYRNRQGLVVWFLQRIPKRINSP